LGNEKEESSYLLNEPGQWGQGGWNLVNLEIPGSTRSICERLISCGGTVRHHKNEGTGNGTLNDKKKGPGTKSAVKSKGLDQARTEGVQTVVMLGGFKNIYRKWEVIRGKEFLSNRKSGRRVCWTQKRTYFLSDGGTACSAESANIIRKTYSLHKR